jgi:hypothetical protein
VVPQAADVAPGHLVGGDAKMLVAERLKPGEHRVDLGLLLHEGGQGILVRPGVRLAGSGNHLGLRLSLSDQMNASSLMLSQKKIDQTVLFIQLTSGPTYGSREVLRS